MKTAIAKGISQSNNMFASYVLKTFHYFVSVSSSGLSVFPRLQPVAVQLRPCAIREFLPGIPRSSFY
jgi:hypothetical protein